MEIRTFRQEDTGSIVDLWNMCLRENQPDNEWYVDELALSESRLMRIASNPNFDSEGAFVASEDGQIIGFGLSIVKRVASYEEESLESLPGYLEGLIVNPSYRNRGIGGQLLQRMESYVENSSKSAIRISRYHSAIAGISVLPHVPAAGFLLERGFRSEQHELKLRLQFKHFSLRDEIAASRTRLEREGIVFTYCEDRYRSSFAQLMSSNFQGWWYGSCKGNLEADEPLPVLIAVDGDQVIGFIGYVAVRENGRANFCPGVDPAYRKRGIGKVLANLWGEAVRQKGAVESIISTGLHNEPAKRIYFDMGYRQIGEFLATLTKDLAG